MQQTSPSSGHTDLHAVKQHLDTQLARGSTPDQHSCGGAPVVAADGCICVVEDLLPGAPKASALQQVCILALRALLVSLELSERGLSLLDVLGMSIAGEFGQSVLTAGTGMHAC